ncbi:MAG: RluA family pseudouridine synthase [Planctomycetes bacterium]|nr:RluA family pseudouridine synthase [Planctomycetota bacterium]
MTWFHKRARKQKKPPANLAAIETQRVYKVERPQVGMRADAFVADRSPWYKAEQVQACFSEGRVRFGDAACPPDKLMARGEELVLQLPPPEEDITEMRRIPYEIVYEDDSILVVSKPPHLIVHPTGGYRYTTLLNALHWKYRSEDPAKDVAPRLVNRIDKETSGLVLLGKTGPAAGALGRALEQREVEKEYLAVVEGVVEKDHQMIDLPIGHPKDTHIEVLRAIDPDGQSAQTEVWVQERFKRFTLVRCRLHTGRMHQIRLHLRAIGHSLVCDHHYGVRDELRVSDLAEPPPAPSKIVSPYGYFEGDSNADVTERIRAADTLKRHEYEALCRGEIVPRPAGDSLLLGRCALHSHRLKIIHPTSGQPLELVAPLPRDVAGALERLRGVN